MAGHDEGSSVGYFDGHMKIVGTGGIEDFCESESIPKDFWVKQTLLK